MAEEREIYYLERDLLLEINRLLGYNALIRDINLLESAINAPQQVAYYEGVDIVTQAAILIERIVLNHPFVDGNKRTALIAGSTFLLVNNLKIVYANEEEELIYAKEIEWLVVSKDRERFLQWLRAHIQPHYD
ncbi:type II toxin-antitoxin system death-on-curing family toxin [Ktedonobacter racemifer]|uniref:Death-on-curing family protein n=1 Tax=Ktedonobacter racemifer DSM 44963 TaxID=485913 RepID=D6TN89_KTERA|nr:type II toxin-antitoxin system death-on-curing family toxin [Ktedonobacter racemifer]EFH87239.1 death-on-curing family protein [Ktedonobacter racemifer DSM 44963]